MAIHFRLSLMGGTKMSKLIYFSDGSADTVDDYKLY